MKRIIKGLMPSALVFLIAIVGLSQDNQTNSSAQEGVEVQGRGEVHEAFAQPSLPQQSPAPIVAKKPPEPVNELPPDLKPEGENVEWIPGYWAWDEDRSDFLWVSGTWRATPPDRDWVPGYWNQAQGGWQWVSGYWTNAEDTETELYPDPPDPIEEAVPAAPDANSTFVSGNWVYRSNQYWWRPGFWVNYRPGWCWISAGYWWTPRGYAFVDGYWDYDLQHRGICFAPVFINSGYYQRPGWYYRPRFAISTNFFLGSLFVNAGWNRYYFGDYYDPIYARRGFSPWINFTTGTRRHDSLYSYYRWRHRDNPGWERDLQQTFTARRDGSMPRPGRTLAQLEKSVPNQKTADVRPIMALDQMKEPTLKLERTPEIKSRQIQSRVEQLRTLSRERSRLETSGRTPRIERDTTPVKEGTSPPPRKEGTTPPPVKERSGTPPTKGGPPATKDRPVPPAKEKADIPPVKERVDAPEKERRAPDKINLPRQQPQRERPSGSRAAPPRPKQPEPQPRSAPPKSPGKKDK